MKYHWSSNVSNNHIIARAHNLTERLNDGNSHAEMQAFTSAAEFLGENISIIALICNYRAMYYVYRRILLTQLNKIVYGAKDSKEA